MKYPEYRLSMEAALPSSVQTWLGQELDSRGIDSLIYTRYIISLLQRDPEDLDGFDCELDFFSRPKFDTKRTKGKRIEKKKASVSEEEKKKHAAIECLTALSDEDAEIEKLVEELCARLKDISATQASVSPVVDVQSTPLVSDSSEESGSEIQNPAERYYAAFPSLHGEYVSPGLSPLVDGENVWGKSKASLKPPCDNGSSPEDELNTNQKAQAAVPNNIKKDAIFRQIKSKPFEKKKKTSGPEKKKCSIPSNLQRSKSNKAHQIPVEKKQKFASIDLDYSQPSEFEFVPIEKDNPKRENEELCTKVESLLKGMLLPTPEKTYKELRDVDDVFIFEQRDRIVRPRQDDIANDMSVIESEVMPREGSVSPELQEQDSWYTQPIDIIFQQAEETTKRPLYKRNSYPRFSPDPRDDCLFSTASSPVPDRSRHFSGISDDEDEDNGLMDGSVLIPAWLTSELSLTEECDDGGKGSLSNTLPTPGSSYRSEIFRDEHEPLVDEHQGFLVRMQTQAYPLKSPEEIWHEPSNNHACSSFDAKLFDKPLINRTWSINDDDDDDYFTPTPTYNNCEKKELGLPPGNLQPTNNERKESMESVSLVDWDYMSRFLDGSDLNGFNFDPSIGGKLENGSTVEVDESHLAVQRQPCLSSLWQSRKLFDDVLFNSETVDECYGTGLHYWQPTGNGGSLSQLWNINLQKKKKVNADCPVMDSQVFDDSIWLFGQKGIGLKEMQDSEAENKNTLIPQISIEVADDQDENVFYESEEVKERRWTGYFDRSLSLGDMRTVFSEKRVHEVPDPKLSLSFELVPSEHSAFDDVPRKLHHVLSEPNLLKFRQGNNVEQNSKPSSPQEHLYFSPKTHFRPITPANVPEQSKPKPETQEYHDLFGGHFNSKTPYQRYVGKQSDEEDESFVPKFKIKNSSKYIQTGESLDKEDQPPSSPETSSSSDECDTPKMLTLGMIEDIVFDKEEEEEADSHGKIDEEFDTTNTDSAYETDYGISVAEQTEHASENKGDQFWTSTELQKGQEEDFGVSHACASSLITQQTSDWSSVRSEDVMDKQPCTITGKGSAGSPWEDTVPWDISGLWLNDTDNDYSYFDGSQASVEKYRNIWSSGQDVYMPDLNRSEDPNVGDGEENSCDCFETDTGLFYPEGYSRVKLVNKDKIRYCKDQANGDQATSSSYGQSDFMPMPDDAVLSSELEKEWLNPDILSWFSRKKSRPQRKPCSFFLEGHCRRSDCKFAHDISNITCRFWEEGGCFKGPLCPFLHGYPSGNSSSSEEASRAKEKELFDLQSDEFPDLGQSQKGTGNSGKKTRPNRSQYSNMKERNGRKQSNSRRSNSKPVRQEKKD